MASVTPNTSILKQYPSIGEKAQLRLRKAKKRTGKEDEAGGETTAQAGECDA
jgi:hypothetical protein